MPSIEVFGSVFEVRVRSSKSGLLKEEFGTDPAYICSEVDEAFTVDVKRKVKDRRDSPAVVRMALSLDGKKCARVHFGSSRRSYTFAGWWTDDLGVKVREFVFSGPSEDCETRPTDASALLIRSTFCVVEKTGKTYVVKRTQNEMPNTDANKQKTVAHERRRRSGV